MREDDKQMQKESSLENDFDIDDFDIDDLEDDLEVDLENALIILSEAVEVVQVVSQSTPNQIEEEITGILCSMSDQERLELVDKCHQILNTNEIFSEKQKIAKQLLTHSMLREIQKSQNSQNEFCFSSDELSQKVEKLMLLEEKLLVEVLNHEINDILCNMSKDELLDVRDECLWGMQEIPTDEKDKETRLAAKNLLIQIESRLSPSDMKSDDESIFPREVTLTSLEKFQKLIQFQESLNRRISSADLEEMQKPLTLEEDTIEQDHSALSKQIIQKPVAQNDPVFLQNPEQRVLNYINVRKAEDEAGKDSLFYKVKTFFADKLDISFSYRTKHSAATKLMRSFEEKDREFTDMEIAALNDGRLGFLVNDLRRSNQLPDSFLQQEAAWKKRNIDNFVHRLRP